MSINDPGLDFCCIGPQRTATTWLYEVLASNDSVCFPKGVKETMFFDQRYSKGMDWYLWHFQDCDSKHRRGEIAPTYFASREACDRLREWTPNLKIIIMVRNPIERTFSLFCHEVSKGRIRVPFGRALSENPELIESSRYAKHSMNWIDRFGESQVQFVAQDDISNSPEEVYRAICKHIEVPAGSLPEVAKERINHASAPTSWALARCFSSTATLLRSARLYAVVEYAKKLGLKRFFSGGGEISAMERSEFRRLKGELESDIRWLEHRLDRDLSSWRMEPSHFSSDENEGNGKELR